MQELFWIDFSIKQFIELSIQISRRKQIKNKSTNRLRVSRQQDKVSVYQLERQGVTDMQIREKGQQVICIKTKYSKEHKRTFGRVVAKQPKHMSTVSNEVRRQLLEDMSTENKIDCLSLIEIEQLVNLDVDELFIWLSKREEKKCVDSKILGLSVISDVMNDASDALDAGVELDQESCEEIVKQLDRLKKSLRKRGIKLTRQTDRSIVDNKKQLKLEE
jgi:predicted HAD superfamily phosphohydrolase